MAVTNQTSMDSLGPDQDTWSCVSSQERHKMHSVLFTGSGKFLISTPCISGTTQRIFIKFTYFMLYIYIYELTYQFEKNRVSGEQDMHFQKLPNFLHIFLLRTAFEEFLNHIKITFLWFDYFQIWHIYKAH